MKGKTKFHIHFLKDIEYLDSLPPKERQWMLDNYILPEIFGDFKKTKLWTPEMRHEVEKRLYLLRTDKSGKGGDSFLVAELSNTLDQPDHSGELGEGSKRSWQSVERKMLFKKED